MCDSYVTNEETDEVSERQEKVLLQFDLDWLAIGNIELGLLPNVDKLTVPPEAMKYLAAQSKSQNLVKLDPAFRRIEIDYCMAFHEFDGETNIVSANANSIKALLKSIISDKEERWLGNEEKMKRQVRAAASRHLWNALRQSQISYQFGTLQS